MENVKRAERIATSHKPQAPRVSLDQVLGSIMETYYFHPAEALPDPNGFPKSSSLWTTTVCVAIMHNGFIVIGKSTPAAPENFDAEVGKKLAHEDCVRQIWPLLGFLLRQTMHENEAGPVQPEAA